MGAAKCEFVRVDRRERINFLNKIYEYVAVQVYTRTKNGMYLHSAFTKRQWYV